MAVQQRVPGGADGGENSLIRWALDGAVDPRLIVAGHSHTRALRVALMNGSGPHAVPAGVVWWEGRFPVFPVLGDDYWDFVAKAARGRAVAIMWWGNQHNNMFLVAPTPPFRVVDTVAPEADTSEAVWVAQESVRERFDWCHAPLRPLLDRLSRVARVLVVGTPPPKSDALIRANAGTESNFARVLGLDMAVLPLTPAPVRLALWRVVQDMLQEEAIDAGLEFVPSPAAAAGPDGLLLPQYSLGDMTHANEAYGALVWAALAAAITGSLEP